MTQPKINVKQLRQIIREEAKAQAVHKAKSQVSNAAADLMDAIEKFKEKATPRALNDITPYLDSVWKLLDHMNDAPGSYIDVPKQEPKKVSLVSKKAV